MEKELNRKDGRLSQQLRPIEMEQGILFLKEKKNKNKKIRIFTKSRWFCKIFSRFIILIIFFFKKKIKVQVVL